MPPKRGKGSKSESSKKSKRANTNSSASSTTLDDKLGSHTVTPGGIDVTGNPSLDDQTISSEQQIDDTTSTIKAPIDEIRMSDDPTLTELIIEKYEGEKQDGRFEGYGMANFVNENRYEGNFVEGTMHGKGIFNWKNVSYKGDFKYNEITGEGQYFWMDGGIYEGQLVKSIRNGFGRFIHPSGMSYEGEWVNGKRHGKGIQKYDPDGKSYYEGDWSQNVIEGYGVRQYPSENVYEGDFHRSRRHGKGTMKWLDRNEEYSGQWKNGVQNGSGRHIWFVKRVKSSQYCMGNMYEGDFVEGKREGYGVFTYASGARYEGYWKNNQKHGYGVFIFKNRNVFEGEFEDGKLKEEFDGRDSRASENRQNAIEMQELIQKDIDNVSTSRLSQCSLNTIGPSFQLIIDHLLDDERILNPDQESAQIKKSVLQNLPSIRKIYQFYSGLGQVSEWSAATNAMTQLQFWRFLKDCKFHGSHGTTLADFNRILTPSKDGCELHSYMKTFILLEFINSLISIAFYLYSNKYIDNYDEIEGQLLSVCFDDMLNNDILPNACNINGTLFQDPQKAEFCFTFLPEYFEIFRLWCLYKGNSPLKDDETEMTLKMRECLILMKKLNLLDDNLTSKDIVNILAKDDPNVTDGQFVCMDIEMTFYEFIELIMACTEKSITKEMVDTHLVSLNQAINVDNQNQQSQLEPSSGDGDGNQPDSQQDDNKMDSLQLVLEDVDAGPGDLSRPLTAESGVSVETKNTPATNAPPKSSSKTAASSKNKTPSADSGSNPTTRNHRRGTDANPDKSPSSQTRKSQHNTAAAAAAAAGSTTTTTATKSSGKSSGQKSVAGKGRRQSIDQRSRKSSLNEITVKDKQQQQQKTQLAVDVTGDGDNKLVDKTMETGLESAATKPEVEDKHEEDLTPRKQFNIWTFKLYLFLNKLSQTTKQYAHKELRAVQSTSPDSVTNAETGVADISDGDGGERGFLSVTPEIGLVPAVEDENNSLSIIQEVTNDYEENDVKA